MWCAGGVLAGFGEVEYRCRPSRPISERELTQISAGGSFHGYVGRAALRAH